MKKLLVAGIAAAAFCSAPALAADLPVKAPARAYVAPAPMFNWTGCYVGGEIGGQWGSMSGDLDYPGLSGTATLHSTGSFIGGGQLGCNWQQMGSSFVFGIEGDVIGASEKFSGEVARFPNVIDHFDATGKIGTQGSLRLKLGTAVDRTLFYVAGGVSFAKLSASSSAIRDSGTFAGSATFDTSSTRTGWNIGAGADYAFAPNWTVGLEGRYTGYGSFHYRVPAGIESGGVSFLDYTASADNVNTWDVRLRLNYKFDWGKAPVVSAKY